MDVSLVEAPISNSFRSEFVLGTKVIFGAGADQAWLDAFTWRYAQGTQHAPIIAQAPLAVMMRLTPAKSSARTKQTLLPWRKSSARPSTHSPDFAAAKNSVLSEIVAQGAPSIA